MLLFGSEIDKLTLEILNNQNKIFTFDKTIKYKSKMKTKKATLSLDLARKMYNGCDKQLKAFAIENYPELAGKITDRIKTFKDACNELGISDNLDCSLTKDERAYVMLKTIVKALNEGWTPNWDDSSELKYYPWFKMSSSGVGFSYDGCAVDYSGTGVGSRLVFKSRELAEYAGKQFEEIYKDFYTI